MGLSPSEFGAQDNRMKARNPLRQGDFQPEAGQSKPAL